MKSGYFLVNCSHYFYPGHCTDLRGKSVKISDTDGLVEEE